MSGYYEFAVEIEGRGEVGVYADDADEARDLAMDMDMSDVLVKDIVITDATLTKTTKTAV